LENSVLKQGLTVLLAAWWLAVTMPVVANEAKPMSNDPVLEARVMVIAKTRPLPRPTLIWLSTCGPRFASN
jgi:hypothetical protein